MGNASGREIQTLELVEPIERSGIGTGTKFAAHPMASYGDALAYLFSLPDSERKPGPLPTRESLLLERPAALLARLGNPQKRFHTILVAGTKGKGSTAAMLSNILQASGLAVGLYTQPHLHCYTERVRVNGQAITREEFADHAARIRLAATAAVQESPSLESFSTFEETTALALDCFARRGIEIAVLEVGMGGRLDATNVVEADLSLITSISIDHTAVLGDGLPSIAFEKAGIIKPGGVCLISPQRAEAGAVIEAAAHERAAALGVSGRDWLCSGSHPDFEVHAAPRPGLWPEPWRHCGLRVPLLGAHQLENAATAVAAAETLKARLGLPVTGDAVRTGLAGTDWPGRLEVLREQSSQSPIIVADGAHNGDSAERIAEALRLHFGFERLWLVMGILGDKNVAAIAAPFVPLAAGAWAVGTPHPRSHSAGNLAAELCRAGIRAEPVNDTANALEYALAAASPLDLICVTGSLSVVAEARRVMGLVPEQNAGPEW